MKQKRDRNDFIFTEKINETLRREQGWLNGQAYKCSKLEGCRVEILDYTGQITIVNCENTTFYIGPCSGSIFIRECKDITIYSSSAQLRISNSNNVTAYIYCKTRPALDESYDITFGPLNMIYDKFSEHFRAAGLSEDVNYWYDVHDFSLEDNDNYDKNYKLLEFGGLYDLIRIDNSLEEFFIPIPKQYGGALDCDLLNSDTKKNDENNLVEDDGLLAGKINYNQTNNYDIFDNNNNSNLESIPLSANNNDKNNALNNKLVP